MVSNSIAKWRLEKGFTKARLARGVGVHRSYVTKLEQGKKQPSGDVMFRIAKELGKPLAEVFEHTPSINGNRFFSGRK